MDNLAHLLVSIVRVSAINDPTLKVVVHILDCNAYYMCWIQSHITVLAEDIFGCFVKSLHDYIRRLDNYMHNHCKSQVTRYQDTHTGEKRSCQTVVVIGVTKCHQVS